MFRYRRWPLALATSAILAGCVDEVAPTATPAPRASASVSVAGGYTLFKLGFFPADSLAHAVDVNDKGDIVGYVETPDGHRAFLWRQGTMIDLGLLFPADGHSSAAAVNNLGQVVGMSGGRAFWWENGTMRSLGSLPGPIAELTDSGEILGFFFTWKQGVITDLGAPMEDDFFHDLQVTAINSRGQVVGNALTPEDYKPFIWENRTMSLFGNPADEAGVRGWVFDLNDLGQGAGYIFRRFAADYRAVRYGPGGASLVDQRPVQFSSYAYGMNNRGQVVGKAETAEGVQRAVLWPGDGTMIELGGPSSEAYKINETGEIIFGRANGRQVFWTSVPILAQSITWDSHMLSPIHPGTMFEVYATGGGSGAPIRYSSLTPAVCTVSGFEVTAIAVGTCTFAADQAGNNLYLPAVQQTQSYPVVPLYDFSGFLSPIQGAPAWNIRNAGSNAPLKWKLVGGQGLAILAEGSPTSRAVSCTSGTPIGAEAPVGTPGQSSLQYDRTSDQYQVNWKTEKGWRGTCREVVLRLIDGSEHTARFRFN